MSDKQVWTNLPTIFVVISVYPYDYPLYVHNIDERIASSWQSEGQAEPI